MSLASLFDVEHQLAFYGAYHTNRINVLIHLICVPLLIWSFLVLSSGIPLPAFVPAIHHTFNEYFIFNLNFPAVFASLYLVYYYVLEPLAALLYSPTMIVSLLTATAFAAKNPDHMITAGLIHGVCWIAQFLGHGLAEKRSPALKDNFLGAVVLAPFFVHMEVLFYLGYRPVMRKRVQNEIGKEVAKLRRARANESRAAQKREE